MIGAEIIFYGYQAATPHRQLYCRNTIISCRNAAIAMKIRQTIFFQLAFKGSYI